MTKFVADASEFVPASTPLPPQTLGDLLAALGVADAPARTRSAAVRRWLKDNTPTPLLKADLVDAGFVPAPPRRTPARQAEPVRARRQRAAG